MEVSRCATLARKVVGIVPPEFQVPNSSVRADRRIEPPEPVSPECSIDLVDAISGEKRKRQVIKREHSQKKYTENEPIRPQEPEAQIKPLHAKLEDVYRAVGQHQCADQYNRGAALLPERKQPYESREVDGIPYQTDHDPQPYRRRPARLTEFTQRAQRVASGANGLEARRSGTKDKSNEVGQRYSPSLTPLTAAPITVARP